MLQTQIKHWTLSALSLTKVFKMDVVIKVFPESFWIWTDNGKLWLVTKVEDCGIGGSKAQHVMDSKSTSDHPHYQLVNGKTITL